MEQNVPESTVEQNVPESTVEQNVPESNIKKKISELIAENKISEKIVENVSKSVEHSVPETIVKQDVPEPTVEQDVSKSTDRITPISNEKAPTLSSNVDLSLSKKVELSNTEKTISPKKIQKNNYPNPNSDVTQRPIQKKDIEKEIIYLINVLKKTDEKIAKKNTFLLRAESENHKAALIQKIIKLIEMIPESETIFKKEVSRILEKEYYR